MVGAPVPVFIGGCPRSGTTLLGAMLGLGKDRLAVPEATFKFGLLGMAVEGRVPARSARDYLSGHEFFRLWGVDLPELPDADVLLDQLLRNLVLAFGQREGKRRPSLWIDHTPGNIRYVASLIHHFPDARFLHIVRDGRAVTASVLPLDWGPNTVGQAAEWWCRHIAQGMAAEAFLGPARMLRVRYEELVTDPESTLRGVCEFLETEFDPAMIRGRDYSAQAFSLTRHELVQQAPDAARLNAWRSNLRPRQVETFEHISGELLHCLGYSMTYGPAARLGSRRDRIVDFLIDVNRRAWLDRFRRHQSRRKARA